MNKATPVVGAWAMLAALPSAASACDSGTLSQAANAHGLSAPYMATPPAPDYRCSAESSRDAGTKLAGLAGNLGQEVKADTRTVKLRSPARRGR